MVAAGWPGEADDARESDDCSDDGFSGDESGSADFSGDESGEPGQVGEEDIERSFRWAAPFARANIRLALVTVPLEIAAPAAADFGLQWFIEGVDVGFVIFLGGCVGVDSRR